MLRELYAHGNFTEYVPMMLILLATFELSDASELQLHLLGDFLMRVMHGICWFRGPTCF